MHDFTPVSALAGGALIGLAAAVLLLTNGRLAAISGIVGGVLVPEPGEGRWRALFLGGLLAGGLLLVILAPDSLGGGPSRPLPAVALAGLLVGFGARVGGGCTSGHGICGIGRLSRRSIVATGTFMATGAAAAWAGRVLFGGA